MDDEFGDDYGIDDEYDQVQRKASNGQALLDEIEELGFDSASPQFNKTP